MTRFSSSTSTNKKGKISDITSIVVSLLFFVASLIIIGKLADASNPLVWIATGIEVGLALAICLRRYSKVIIYTLLFIAMFIPLILASAIDILRPIVISPIIFGVALFAIQTASKYVRRLKNKTTSIKLPLNLAFKAVFPDFLPRGLELRENYSYKKKKQTILEIYYQNENDGSLLEIYQSDGIMVRPKMRRPLQDFKEQIHGIPVNVTQKFRKAGLARKFRDILYIEATWNKDNIYLHLHSEGISLEDVEKIIASMLK